MRAALIRRLAIAWLGNCLGLALAAAVVPAISYGRDLGTLLLAGAILGIVNISLRPALIVLALPAVLLSLGLALLLINTLMLWVTSELVSGLRVGGFFSTLAGAVIVWLANLLMRHGARPATERKAPFLAIHVDRRR